ncbi:transport permease protein [Pullulanibacillus camelliae]|uniref:Transport permease protein n=1 Tax=Pullulanibacillus camelliae TaxID=1707096 RepID=A0A8J3E122_9BACL|nr:ABC transporter permease [Pullulanibacillus camelliae]GGE56674.1 transport permease protein [Pullulanibacillus camelliae]
MGSLVTVLKEQIKSFYLVRRLSFYEMKSENNNNYLGILWELISPLIQIAVYAFVFGFGIIGSGHGRKPVDHIDYFSWLIAGFCVWYFINQAIIQGSRSVFSRIRMVSKMSFPTSVIPTYVIFAKFYQHLMLLVIVVIMLQFSGHLLSIQFLQIPYYMFASILFLVALSLITSTLSTIIRDVHMLLQAVMRMLLYLSPILWLPDPKNTTITFIMKLNPIYYLVEGYRSALLGDPSWYMLEHLRYTIYFWVVVIILFIIGSKVHIKFRDRFIDFL